MENERLTYDYWIAKAEGCGIPDYMREGIARYVVHGINPGDFLYAVFSNDLVEAFMSADATNIQKLFLYAGFLYAHAPFPCWKSRAKVDLWIESGGLHGKQ